MFLVSFLKYRGMVTSTGSIWIYFHLRLINLSMYYYGYGIIHILHYDWFMTLETMLENSALHDLHNMCRH